MRRYSSRKQADAVESLAISKSLHKAFDQDFLREFNNDLREATDHIAREFNNNLREATDQVARNASASRRRPARLALKDYTPLLPHEDSAAARKYLERRERLRTRGRKVLHPTSSDYVPLPLPKKREESGELAVITKAAEKDLTAKLNVVAA
jgi:hypothetical protein